MSSANPFRCFRGLKGSARVSRAGFGVSPKRTFLEMPFAIVCAIPEKFAMARRHRQHARRVRYPDVRVLVWVQSLRAFFEGGGFAAEMRERFTGEVQRAGQ